jgi:signal transduction histidine kinase
MTFTTPDILIVEDEELNRDIMARRMHNREYSLRFAEDGQQALDQVADKKPDLVLLDIMLPEIMGLQVLHTLRQRYSMVDLPIIMVTAIDEDTRIIRALELGANDYVTKPIHFPVLLARIQTQLSLKQLAAFNTEFLTTASHDLRRPLALIQDIASRARQRLTGQEDYTEEQILDDMNLIMQSASYMQNITDCILDMQASGFGQIRLTMAPLHMENLADELVDRHREYANEKKISLICKHGSNKLIAEADRSRITQVMNNLMSNAIERCSAGDIITLAVHAVDQDVHVSISDTGSSLSNPELNRLFNRNVELPDQAEDGELSTSSTLPLCKQLIEQHGGSIGAHNNEQHGATFWFSLPLFRLRPVP